MKTMLTTLMTGVLLTSVVSAQGRQAAPPPPPAAPAPARPQQPAPPPLPPPAGNVNVRIDIVVIDEGGPQTLRETVSLTTTDRQEASSRSEAQLGNGLNPTILNVDATPQVSGLPAGKVRLRVSLDYLPRLIADDQARGTRTRTRLQFGLVLEDGKTLVASDVTDPATDRRVKVEVTATLLK